MPSKEVDRTEAGVLIAIDVRVLGEQVDPGLDEEGRRWAEDEVQTEAEIHAKIELRFLSAIKKGSRTLRVPHVDVLAVAERNAALHEGRDLRRAVIMPTEQLKDQSLIRSALDRRHLIDKLLESTRIADSEGQPELVPGAEPFAYLDADVVRNAVVEEIPVKGER